MTLSHTLPGLLVRGGGVGLYRLLGVVVGRGGSGFRLGGLGSVGINGTDNKTKYFQLQTYD